LNKDVVHPSMRRHIENPRIILLDCPLEYKKAESQTNVEITKEADFDRILKMEEDYIQEMCAHIIRFKPDLVCTEKGVSDLAQHFLAKANISVLRRLRKTDNNRIARSCGATIVYDPSELRESDVGTGCGLFEVRKIGDEYFSYIINCKNPKACTVVLRGASKDVLNEIERNLLDAMGVVRNILVEPLVVPGGGAIEMSLAKELYERAKLIPGLAQGPYRAVAQALEIIPKTLIENCGGSPIRVLTALRAQHAKGDSDHWGVDGIKGEIRDVREIPVWESLMVKTQTIKTALESAILILRVGDIVSGLSGNKDKQAGGGGAQANEEEETFGDARDG